MKPPVAYQTLYEAGALASAARPRDLVSVVVSLHQYEAHIGECLDTVAAQQHRPLELIVVDDASRDQSAVAAAAWMARHAARFHAVALLRHRTNQGLAETRNTGFLRACAEHVMVLDADNGLYPRCIGRLLECKEDARAAVAYAQLAMFGDDEATGYADVWAPERFRPANYVDAMALVSRSAWAQVGGYDHLEYGWEDFDFWCKFVEAGLAGVFVPEMLCRYRVHQTSMLRSRTDLKRAQVIDQMMYRRPWLDLVD